MLYFIPAWYRQNQWREHEQDWYVRHERTEFDDTVKQIQLFHRNDVMPYQILLLGYSPNFRHFLHRQSVYHAPYWNVFDAIQEVERRQMRVLSYHDIVWPKDVEFLYTPVFVEVRQYGRRYAKIEFGEDGNPIEIHIYKNDQISRRNVYDDRGFVSSTVVYEDGRAVYQDYLMENGTHKMRHYFADDHVEINPEARSYRIQSGSHAYSVRFLRQRYASMDEVIAEVLQRFLAKTSAKDIFCVAMHQRHIGVLQKTLKNRRMILSFFEDRFPSEQYPDVKEFMLGADYMITDLQKKAKELRRFLRFQYSNIISLTPYDSRVDLGISQQLSVQKVLIPVDGVGEELFAQLVVMTGHYIRDHRDVEIHLFTRRADLEWTEFLLRIVAAILKQEELPAEWAMNENGYRPGEISPDQRFFVEQCVDEREVSKCMRQQRVLVDLREVPELYLQITAISIGIPQIVRTSTQFVEDRKNGWLIQETAELPKVLDYYLCGMKNWNEAMVYAYEIGKKFSTPELIRKWREVIETIG